MCRDIDELGHHGLACSYIFVAFAIETIDPRVSETKTLYHKYLRSSLTSQKTMQLAIFLCKVLLLQGGNSASVFSAMSFMNQKLDPLIICIITIRSIRCFSLIMNFRNLIENCVRNFHCEIINNKLLFTIIFICLYQLFII